MSQKAPQITIEHDPEDDRGQKPGSGQMSVEDELTKIKKIVEELEKPELKPFIAKDEEEELSRCKPIVDATDPNEPEFKRKFKRSKKLVKAIQKRVAEHKFAVSSLQNLITALKTVVDNFDRGRYKYIKPAVKSCLKIQWENTDAWLKKALAEPIQAGEAKKELEQRTEEYELMKQQLYTLFDIAVKKLEEDLSKHGKIGLGLEEGYEGRSRSLLGQQNSKISNSSRSSSSRSGSRSKSPRHGSRQGRSILWRGRINKGCSPSRSFEPPYSWSVGSKDLHPPGSRDQSDHRH
ncbi:unnamed protein product [Calicophoron daubneyi]|uniref:Uncharacterized protein n=1 Tax=Calicophoron daubneyi TaxID=300641 RepID=A0AAV2TQI5_CALDB